MAGIRGQEASSSTPDTCRLVHKALQERRQTTVTFYVKADLQCQIVSPPSFTHQFSSLNFPQCLYVTLLSSSPLLKTSKASPRRKLFLIPETTPAKIIKRYCAIWLVAAIWHSEEIWAQCRHKQSAILGPEPTRHEQRCSTGPEEQEPLLVTDALGSTKAARSKEIARRTCTTFLLKGILGRHCNAWQEHRKLQSSTGSLLLPSTNNIQINLVLNICLLI